MSTFFIENCKNWVQKQRSYAISSERCHDCPKKEILILSIPQINIKSIEALIVDMDLILKKIILIIFKKQFLEDFLVYL